MAGLRCILLERGADLHSGASKGNSAILHTGFDVGVSTMGESCNFDTPSYPGIFECGEASSNSSAEAIKRQLNSLLQFLAGNFSGDISSLRGTDFRSAL
jgi:hypothetical protein